MVTIFEFMQGMQKLKGAATSVDVLTVLSRVNAVMSQNREIVNLLNADMSKSPSLRKGAADMCSPKSAGNPETSHSLLRSSANPDSKRSPCIPSPRSHSLPRPPPLQHSP